MGDDAEQLAKIGRFMEWLKENGATFPKIDFPRNDTPSGIRGGIALEDIATNEHMMVIPAKLMMSPLHILADPIYGPVLDAAKDLLRGDFLMTVFLMHEMRLGDASFYKPYIDILPVPDCISEWNDAELNEFQDERIKLRAKNRRLYIANSYKRVVLGLHREHPLLFPLEEFTLTNFTFAFNTVQARAFGRRLPWTALVPFADCLNHSNVQTKYDYNVDGNGVFRLFPTGRNAYPKGSEVLNSYGRRENENLLMDYGFAMLPNHWDEVELILVMSHEAMQDSEFLHRRELLARKGYKVVEIFPFTHFFLPLEALSFARCLTQQDRRNDGGHRSEAATMDDWLAAREDELAALTFLQTTVEMYILQHFTTDIAQDDELLDKLARQTDGVDELREHLPPPAVPVQGDSTANALLKEDGAVAPPRVVATITAAAANDDEFDVEQPAKPLPISRDHWMNAIRYRLTRKHILQRLLTLLDTLIDLIALSETRSPEDNDAIIAHLRQEYINDDSDSAAGAIYVKPFRRTMQHKYLDWVHDTLLYPSSAAATTPL